MNNGGFMAVWQTVIDSTNSHWDIMARQFDANGYPVNVEFSVTPGHEHKQYYPALTTLTDGRIAVSYSEQNPEYY
jgi:hypothetical protein